MQPFTLFSFKIKKSLLGILIFTLISSELIYSTTTAIAASGGGEKVSPEEEAKAKEELEKAKKEFEITTLYKHKWIRLPNIVGKSVNESANILRFEPKKGRAVIVSFLASYCIACQEIAPQLKKLEAEFADKVDFISVFVADQAPEAFGFIKEHGISRAVLSNHDILKDYHNPELPTIYIADRNNWLKKRYIKPKSTDFEKLREDLHKMFAF